MKKANFHSLKAFAPDIFDNADTWEDFMRKFTDDEHIIGSKYVRQVILGNCNPKRHITYEKYLMHFIILSLAEIISPEDIICFSNDEVVVKTDNNKKYDINEIEECVKNSYFGQHIPFKVEEFKLDYLGEGIGYIKRYDDEKFKLKCVDNDYFPMILRLIQSGYVMLNDLFFVHKGALARFNDVPKNIREVFNYDKGAIVEW